MNYFAENTNLMVNIVNKNLRSIGEYKVFTATPNTKEPQGNYFWNKIINATAYDMYRDEVLREQLIEIQNKDADFFAFVVEKLGLSVWLFDEETDRRKEVANHTPHQQKYAIHEYTDDKGFQYNPIPMTFITIATTGDDRADETTAIKAALNIEMGVGFYKGIPTTDAKIAKEINKLEDKINSWNNGF